MRKAYRGPCPTGPSTSRPAIAARHPHDRLERPQSQELIGRDRREEPGQGADVIGAGSKEGDRRRVGDDLDLAGQEADSLRRFGYEVVECGGPTRNRCPVLAGHSCDLAERADVLVYDVWASGDAEGARTLIENIRDIHPDTPVVLTSPGLQLAWEESIGTHAVTPLLGQPTGARLHEAIQSALGSVTPH